jgi:hypothetical protein
MRSVRKKLAVTLSQAFSGKCDGNLPGIGMSGGELLNLPTILFAENGARRIQQFTTSAEQLPKRVENLGLTLPHGSYIRRLSQPLDIRVTAYDTGCGTRHVGEDAIKKTGIAPGCGIAGVGLKQLCVQ